MGKNSKAADRTLFSEFPPVSREEWEEVISNDLKGADYRERLLWETGEGIEALPFYRRDDLKELNHAGPVPSNNKREKNDWEIRQPVYDHTPSEARESITHALERGVEALQLKLRVHKTDGMLGGDLEGTAIQGQNDFNGLLGEISLGNTGLHFDASMASPALLAMLHNYAEKRQADRNSITATYLYDPYLYTATSGQLPKPEQAFLDEARQMVEFTGNHYPQVRPLGVDARAYHNAGATVIQELAFALATGSEYLAKLSERGLSIPDIASGIHFTFAVGSSYFIEIAKFRAIRLLWPMVLEAYLNGTQEPLPAYIHGETSERNKTVFDPYTNMLRTTTEGMSAAIAGCDAITIHPFDMTYREPDDFGLRIARNAQIIFREEAMLDQVHDPGAGSYYIETLTDQTARKSWELFREIEQQGGMLKAITNGTVASLVGQSVEARDSAVAERKRVFVGTNRYPNADEQMAGRMEEEFRASSLLESDSDHDFAIDNSQLVTSLAEAFDKGALMGDVVPALFDLGKQLFRPVEPYRATGAFEALRLATERHGKTPQVLTLPLGDRKQRKARSTFAANFLGCAGYEIEDPIGFDSAEEALAAIRDKKPDIVVLCSSDEEYSELVGPVCTGIRSMKKQPLVVLAGYPENKLEEYREAGVDKFIHKKSNVLESLKEFHDKLGIEL